MSLRGSVLMQKTTLTVYGVQYKTFCFAFHHLLYFGVGLHVSPHGITIPILRVSYEMETLVASMLQFSNLQQSFSHTMKNQCIVYEK